ncbi:MAG TPA: hypothetical protein VMM82_00160 [Spirochaetia bacterium]|nr:hypothetical protein [Spirochaetia bacterium]
MSRLLKPRTVWVFAALVSLLAPSAFAQVGQNPLDRPELRKFWNPRVGKGAVYERVENDSGKKTVNMEIQTVGKESVGGKEAYWIEFAFETPEMKGTSYGKSLIVFGETHPRRTIFQFPGMSAMEMPSGSTSRSNLKMQDLRKVGTETVTVPAGTFTCEHWKSGDSDLWVSAKVSPFSVVKEVSKGTTEVLVKTVENATDHITGPVKPFDAKVFMQYMAEQKGKN